MKTATTSLLGGGVIVCGAVGLWASGSPSLSGLSTDRIISGAGILAFILAAIALRRRSWARLPLLAVCVLAGSLVWHVNFDQSEGIALYAYLGVNFLITLAGGLALIISILDAERPRQSTTP